MIPTQDLLEELKKRCEEEIIVCAFYDADPETPAPVKFFLGGDISERIKLVKYLDYVIGSEFLGSLNIYPEQ